MNEKSWERTDKGGSSTESFDLRGRVSLLFCVLFFVVVLLHIFSLLHRRRSQRRLYMEERAFFGKEFQPFIRVLSQKKKKKFVSFLAYICTLCLGCMQIYAQTTKIFFFPAHICANMGCAFLLFATQFLIFADRFFACQHPPQPV